MKQHKFERIENTAGCKECEFSEGHPIHNLTIQSKFYGDLSKGFASLRAEDIADRGQQIWDLVNAARIPNDPVSIAAFNILIVSSLFDNASRNLDKAKEQVDAFQQMAWDWVLEQEQKEKLKYS